MAVSNKKVAFSILLVLFLATAAIAGAIYVQLSDLNQIKKMAVEKLEDLTGHKVSIGTAKFDFAKGISIQLQDVKIGGAHAGRPKFSAKSLWMVIKLLPLFYQKIDFRKIIIQGVSVQVIRDKKGRFNLGPVQQWVAGNKGEEGLFTLLKGSLINQLELQKGEIHFFDYRVPSGGTPFSMVIRNLHFSIRKKFLKTSFKYKLTGEMITQAPATVFTLSGTFGDPSKILDPSQFTINGKARIKNLRMATLKPYLKKWIPLSSRDDRISLESRFSGSLAGKLKSSGNLVYVFQQDTAEPAFRDPAIPIRNTLEYKISLNQKEEIEFKEVKMESGPFGFRALGKISRFRSKNPFLSFDIQTDAFQVNKSRSYLPLRIFPKEYHRLVHQRFKNGTFQIESLKFAGTLDQFKNLAAPENHKLFSGQLHLKRVDWLDPLPPLKNVTGSFALKGGDSIVDVRKASYEGTPISNLKGTVHNLLLEPIADLSLENPVDIGVFHKTLLKILDDHSYKEFVSIYRDLKGKGYLRLQLKGPLNDPDRYSLMATLIMKNVSLYQLGLEPRIDHLYGTIHYNQLPEDQQKQIPIIKFEEFSGNFGKSSFSDLKGEVISEKGTPIKNISGVYNLHARELPEIVGKMSLEQPLDALRHHMTYLEGGIQVAYHSRGNPLRPDTIREWGEIRLKDFSLKYQDRFFPMTNLSGTIAFGRGTLRFIDVKGWYGKSPIQLEGDVIPYTKRGPQLALLLKFPNFQRSDLAGIPFFQDLNYTGAVEARLKLEGTLDDLKFDYAADMTRASYQYGDIFLKDKNYFNQVKINGHYSPKDGVILKNLVYELGQNKITGKARLESFETPRFAVTLYSRDFSTPRLAPFFDLLKNNKKGTSQFRIQGRGNLNRLKDAQFSGSFTFKDLVFASKDIPSSMTVNAKVNFSEKTFRLQDGRLESSRSRARFNGVYQTGARPKMDITLTGEALILDELIPASAKGQPDIGKLLNRSDLFSKGSVKIRLDLKKINYRMITLKAVSGNILIEKKKLKINQLNFGEKNKIRGRGIFNMTKSGTPQFRGLLQAKDVRAEDFLGMFGETFRNGLTGKLKTLDIRFKGTGEKWSEFGKSMVAKAAFDFQSGLIDRPKLKRGVLKLFHVPAGGTPPAGKANPPPSLYKQIAGNFTFAKGIAETENFVYESQSRRMSLVGKFDLNRYEMDTVLGVAPMAALDKFLTKIPVVGKIITGGDEESLVKTYYTVKGKFDDPKVSPIPFTSLGKKVMGIFQGILQTPGSFLQLPADEPIP
ncbi:MAG: AsmA-like C-terminal domain-containing protein [Nitrospinaceae bacterium]